MEPKGNHRQGRACSESGGISQGTSRADSSISRRTFLAHAGVCASLLVAGPSMAMSGERRGVDVGFMLPEQGPRAGEAFSFLSGFLLYLKDSESSSVRTAIHKSDPGEDEKTTLESLADLIGNKKVRFLVGPFSAPACERVIHGMGGMDVVLFVTNPSVKFVGGDLCTTNSFRIAPNTYQCSRPMAPWALLNVGKRAFITGKDALVENEQADFFAFGFERSGGTFVDRIMYSDDPESLDGVQARVATTETDCIFVADDAGSALPFLQKLHTASPELTAKVLGPPDLCGYPEIVHAAGSAASGVRTPAAKADPLKLTARIKSTLGRDITDAGRAMEGYNTAAVICRTAEALGSQAQSLDEIVKHLESNSFQGLERDIRFDANHEPIISPCVVKWKIDGTTVTREILDELGPVDPVDFGCGRIGFPDRPDIEFEEQEETSEEGVLQEE